jgi:hypothetical protein
VAPVAMMTVSASTATSSALILNGRLRKSTSVTSSAIISVPKRAAWALKVSMRGGPSMPSTKPG